MSEEKKGNPGFVTHAECATISRETRDFIKDIGKNIKTINLDIAKIKDSIYGTEKAGIITGGLVNMMRDIKKNGINRGLGNKEKAAIIIAFITSFGSVIVTYLKG